MPKGKPKSGKRVLTNSQSALAVLARNYNFQRGQIQGTIKALNALATRLGLYSVIPDINTVGIKLLARSDNTYSRKRVRQLEIHSQKELQHGTSKAEKEATAREHARLIEEAFISESTSRKTD